MPRGEWGWGRHLREEVAGSAGGPEWKLLAGQNEKRSEDKTLRTTRDERVTGERKVPIRNNQRNRTRQSAVLFLEMVELKKTMM